MRQVTAVRSALASAVAGTAIVALVLLLATLVSAQGHDAWNATVLIGSRAVGWRVPVVTAVLIVGPPVLAAAFGTFFLIGRRAARPIEVARRQQLDFTADASHELRTPLTVIEGEASLALGRPRDTDAYRQALEKVAAESRHMRRLVDDLLWLARTETDPDRPAAETVDLAELAYAAVGRFQGVAAEKRMQISATPAGGPPPVLRAPAAWMERLLAVLLENACRYTPASGVVRVRTGAGPGGVFLAVEDSGPGIPAGEADRIFERFHRASAAAGGSGLGLAIASRVVAETGGTWRVGRSELGGASFAVTWKPSRVPTVPRAVREPSRSDS